MSKRLNNSKNIRMKMVATEVVKGKPMRQAMKEAGYSDSYASASTTLTQTKSWNELMKEFMPDDLLATVHNAAIKAKKLIKIDMASSLSEEECKQFIEEIGGKYLKRALVIDYFKGEPDGDHWEVWYVTQDFFANDRAIDKAYKLKGSYMADKIQIEDSGKDINNMTPEELEAEEQRVEKELGYLIERKRLYGKRKRSPDSKK